MNLFLRVKNYLHFPILFFFFFIFVTDSFAQSEDVKFKHISIEEGLSQSTVYTICQDSRGFMWFGTQDGLNRFDGYNFNIYKHSPDDTASLSNNDIWAIYEDSRENIWIGTYGGGLNKFNRNTETFTSYLHSDDDWNTIISNNVWCIFEDSNKNIWLGTSNGLDKFDPEKEAFNHFQHIEGDGSSLSHNIVKVITEDKNGNLWIGTDNGLNKFNIADSKFTQYLNNPRNKKSISGNRITSILVNDDNTIWIGVLDRGLNKYNPIDNSFLHYLNSPVDNNSISSNKILTIHEDKLGNLWIGTDGGGLNSFQKQKNNFVRFLHNPDNPESLSDNNIKSFYEDDSGVLWLGTASKGIDRFVYSVKNFAHYQLDPEGNNSLSSNNIRSFCEDQNGNLWIGTYGGGVNKLDLSEEKFVHYKFDEKIKNSISNNNVWSIIEDSQGDIWFGTSNGLNQFNQTDESFRIFKTQNNRNSISSNVVISLFQDRDDNIWIGTSNAGLNKFNLRSNTFTHYKNNPEDENSLSHNIVYTIREDSKNILWIGTMNGLNRFDPKSNQFKHYSADPKDPTKLSHNVIVSICEDSSGVLWLGTYGGGLNRFDKTTEIFKVYREADGLPNNVVYGILNDGDDLWLSTNRGLSKFNTTTEVFKNYDTHDGLQHNEFNNGAYHKGRNGDMYFGGINGFNSFNPKNVLANQHKPPIVITDFQIFNESVTISDNSPLEKSIEETKAITLSYKDNVFSFEFSALDYTVFEKNMYKYIMEGFDEAWIDAGTRRFVTYTNLDPGDYVFKVMGSNNDGIWNNEGTQLDITITPPFWKTWWAYIIYIVSLVGAILGYVRYKTKAQAKELERQKKELEQERLVAGRLREVDKLKDDFLANTSHELRTPLNGIIGIAESLVDTISGKGSSKIKENLSMIASSGKRLATLVNSILDFSKLKTHNLELQLKPVDLRALTTVVLKLSEPLIGGKNLVLKNEIPEDIPAIIGDENRLQQIMHNLIGNGIKFTESGHVTVRTAATENFVTVSVTDTGIGIPKEKFESIFKSFEQVDASTSRTYGGTGLGLAITKQLVELHGGKVTFESAINQGSIFRFTIPISSDKNVVASIPEPEVEQISLTEESEIEETDISEIQADESMSFSEFRILVVDDEEINQQVLGNHLSFYKFTLFRAMNGEEALKIITEEEKFDLVLLDIMMPRMSGYEVCQKIREKYLPNELPVIMLTAKNQVSDLVEGLSSGANDYLTKPFSKNELVARIQTQLNLLKINEAYERFVPHEFLWTLGQKNIIDVKLGDQVQGTMTILFSDIRSFTSISEGMTPKENFDFLNNYLKTVTPSFRKYNGFIDKYIGDAIMALFPQEPEDAVHACIELVQSLNHFNDTYRSNETPINIGIGIHTGSLMLGTLGDDERMDGTVISDAVNLSSRLEGLTKIFGATAIISENTLSQISNKEKYNYRFLGKVCVKGKSQMIRIYELIDCCSGKEKEYKLNTKAEFDLAIKSYAEKNFEIACENFNKVLRVNENDTAASLYFNRCQTLKAEGVSEDWEGVEIIDSK